MYSANDIISGHPMEVMKGLGITYQKATPQSMLDIWLFWNCSNLPEPLPEYLLPIDADPMEYVGWGLSQQEAERIRDYKQ